MFSTSAAMDLDCPHLSLAPTWADDDDRRRIVVVDALAALRLRRDGAYEAVSAWEVLWDFERASSDLGWEIQDFAMRIGLCDPYGIGSRDQDVVEVVTASIRRGDLVGLRKGQVAAAATEPTVEQRRLAADVERQTRGRLREGSRDYKLVAGADLARVPDRNGYEVVARAEATRVLSELAKQSGGRADASDLFGRARDKLSPDWRPPLAPNGLVLLRKIHAPQAVIASPEPAITPSQLRALTASGWIEIEFVDELGEPVEAAYLVELPDSTLVEGASTQDGTLSRANIKQGICHLTLPTLDAARWRLGQ
jgi:hypothetical protein